MGADLSGLDIMVVQIDGIPLRRGGGRPHTGERLVKIGARIVRHSRSISFQMTGVMVPYGLFQIILGAIAALRPLPPARC
jgi:hypothetical protein